MPSMSLVTAVVVSTNSIVLILVCSYLNEIFYKNIFIFLTIISLTVILINSLEVVSIIDVKEPKNKIFTTQFHFLFQLIPVSYLFIKNYIFSSIYLDFIYYIPILVFFYSGLFCWKKIYHVTNNKIFRIYQVGNTQMLIYFILAIIYDRISYSSEIPTKFSSLLSVYFFIHFLISGVTVVLLKVYAIKKMYN